ncbi:actin-like protein 7A [Lepisosteus oculatus]|uniref:actin-like protein 7A n=1 Tax=Lepisosteus oculatus TaxID=7918 RepID=UPI0035F51999
MSELDQRDGLMDPITPTKGPAKVAKLIKINSNEGPSAPDKHPIPKSQQRVVVKRTKAVIIDLGTGYLKAGFAGQPGPSCVIPSAEGVTRRRSDVAGFSRRESFVGKELLQRPDLEWTAPLQHGIVTDWEAVERLWEYVFQQELQVPFEEHAVLVSDPPLSPTTNREKFAELMFETFSIPAIHIAYQSVLSVYSYGRTTGIVLESGHGCSYAVPIHDGYHMPSHTGRVDYGGQSLDAYLLSMLQDSGKTIPDNLHSIVEDIKKKCCYISLDTDHEMSLDKNDCAVDYELPDGHLISIGKERFACPEALFQPIALGSREPGLQTMVMNCINKCDIQIKKDLLKNIVVCGGSTMFPGFPERLQYELDKIAPRSEAAVVAVPERNYAVWRGGSILASLQAFQSLWVRKEEYEERGPFIIYRKCF